jgi:hypothetical protein
VEGYFSQSQGFNCVRCWQGNSQRIDLSSYTHDELLEIISTAKELLKKSSSKKINLRSGIKAKFLEVYEKLFGVNYYWTGKDAKSTVSIVNKIKTKLAANGQITDESLISGFEAFITKTYMLNDSWLTQNFSPSVIDSQFNQIYLKIKNGKSTKSTVTESFRERVARQAYGQGN